MNIETVKSTILPALVGVAAMMLAIGTALGSVAFPTTQTKITTVTNTYTSTVYPNQNSTYYLVCVVTSVIGHSYESLGKNTTNMLIVPFETDYSTFISITNSSASLGYVMNDSGTNCTYVSTDP
jgi:hypothetical protein